MSAVITGCWTCGRTAFEGHSRRCPYYNATTVGRLSSEVKRVPIKIESRAQAYDIRKVREALREATTAAYGKTVADIVLENFGGALIVHTDATVEPLRSVIGEALRILDAKTTPTDYLHQRSRAVTVLADSPNFVHASLAARIGDAIVMLQNDADRYEVIATLRGVTDPEQTSIK